MANRTSTVSKRYRIADNEEVTVTIVIGAGQPGGWALALDDKYVESGEGDEKTVELGKGKDVLFKELRIDFVIHDRRWEHDRLIATTIVTCGEAILEITHDKDGDQGDSATYTTLVQFI